MSIIRETGVGKEIPLAVIGYDFRNASTTLREKLVTTVEDRDVLFKSIREFDTTAGLLILETCNRLEWIVSTHIPEHIIEFLAARIHERLQQFFIEMTEIPSPYVFLEKDAVIHLLRVVVGMKSLAEGEAQIARQFQIAIIRAQHERTSSPIINKLSHSAGRLAKTASRIGFRSNNRQGIHCLVMKFLKNYFHEDPKNKTILVVGMGEIGRKVAALLQEIPGWKLKVFNRTIKPQQEKNWAPLEMLKKASAFADALIVATGSHHAILDLEDINIEERNEKLLILDIGIPRQLTLSVQKHPKINYCNIDHLIGLSGLKSQCKYQGQLENEICKEFYQYRQFCRAWGLTTLLSEIHTGQSNLTENLIPDSLNSQLSDLQALRRMEVIESINKLIKNYSKNLYSTFHNEMEKYWNRFSKKDVSHDELH